MRCSSVRPKLMAMQDGDLSRAERSAVEAHLRECSDCAREWAQLQRTVALVESLGELETPHGFTANVLRAVAEEQVEEPAGSRFSLGHALAAAAALASALIVTGALGFGPLDLSGWEVAFASLAGASAETLGTLFSVIGVVGAALVDSLGRPFAWVMAADVGALLLVLAAARRLLAARLPRNITGLLAL